MVWGFAEATLFFFVPDIFLSRVALDAPKRAFVACGFALAGALIGGAIMFAWGRASSEPARAALDAVPGISEGMIATVGEDFEELGATALFFGPPRGVPYKIYAVEWGAAGGSFAEFLLVSIPARVLRFLLVAALAVFVRRTLLSKRSRRVCLWFHAACWVSFYTAYFWLI